MSNQHNVRLSDIAQKTGLHTMTVSRVLRGLYQGRRDTVERVLQAAREMNYSPNLIARAMQQRSLPVVLVCAHTDLYSAAYIHALNAELNQAGLYLMVEYSAAGFSETRRQFRPAASVLLGTAGLFGDDEMLQASDVIAITTGPLERSSLGCYCIHLDFETGFAALGRRLAELGHRRYLFIHDILNAVSDRELMFKTAIQSVAGASVQVGCAAQQAQVREVIDAAFNQRPSPTAIVCCIDGVAIECILQLSYRGLCVPSNVSVTGCDGISWHTGNPHLTTLRVPHQQVAAQVRQWVVEEMANPGRSATVQQTVLPCSLWEGQSTAPVPTTRRDLDGANASRIEGAQS
jgi:DNA-binding LacI/PurR family transcriptional regulator